MYSELSSPFDLHWSKYALVKVLNAVDSSLTVGICIVFPFQFGQKLLEEQLHDSPFLL